jgi:hypothetical protein
MPEGSMAASFHSIKCCWPKRPETSEILAARLARQFVDLAAIHPSFSAWRWGGLRHRSKAPRLCAVPPRIEDVQAVFDENKEFGAVNGRKALMSHGVWAYEAPGLAPRRILYLLASVKKKPGLFGNMVTITLLTGRDPSDFPTIYPAMTPALLALAKAWDAPYGAIDQTGLWHAPEPGGPMPRYRGGARVYLAADLAAQVALPEAMPVEPTALGGVLVTAVREIYDPDNEAHVASVRALDDALAPLNKLDP